MSLNVTVMCEGGYLDTLRATRRTNETRFITRDLPTLKSSFGWIYMLTLVWGHVLKMCWNPHHHLTPLSAWKQTSNIYSTWPSEWKPFSQENSFLFDMSICHSNSASPREAFQSFFSIASTALQVRSAVRKRWHRWQDNHSLRMRVARAMSIPTSPTRISFHSIKQTTAVWAGEWVHNRHRIWENGLNLSVKYEQPEWFVYTRPERVRVGPSLWVRVASASKQPETHSYRLEEIIKLSDQVLP